MLSPSQPAPLPVCQLTLKKVPLESVSAPGPSDARIYTSSSVPGRDSEAVASASVDPMSMQSGILTSASTSNPPTPKPLLPNPGQAQKKMYGSEHHWDPAPTRTPMAPSSESAGTQVMELAGQGRASASGDAEMATAPRI
ncbi:hypothetical protein NDU88_004145 [Pleurodeles waltl]|uniref:Uncharacterized protein n=1 Tax=Pleurodeles waltl TaxID=8319 RepID=A0AAV7WR48_PLEWA|nr:hypothetical protein NDU88_004145 [Pleurodeles waltl]